MLTLFFGIYQKSFYTLSWILILWIFHIMRVTEDQDMMTGFSVFRDLILKKKKKIFDYVFTCLN